MVSLKKQLALRKTVFKKEKRKKRALIEIVFYKHIKKLSAFKYFKCTQKCAQMGNFSAHINLKIFFIIKLKVLEFFKLNCVSISQNSHPKAKAFLPPVVQIWLGHYTGGGSKPPWGLTPFTTHEKAVDNGPVLNSLLSTSPPGTQA